MLNPAKYKVEHFLSLSFGLLTTDISPEEEAALAPKNQSYLVAEKAIP